MLQGIQGHFRGGGGEGDFKPFEAEEGLRDK